MTDCNKTVVILLAGGIGSRMGSKTPKQYLELCDKPIALHSFETFLEISEIEEIVVVCTEEFRELFKTSHQNKIVSFANPGERRQDSVWSGMQAIKSSSNIICVHDAARPFIDRQTILSVIESGAQHGAATVGVPAKSTIKVCNPNGFVKETLDRSTLWEIQTPQVVRRDWLEQGFAFVNERGLSVTDDVSIIELIGKPVKVVEGSYDNIKITTPEDLRIAEALSYAIC